MDQTSPPATAPAVALRAWAAVEHAAGDGFRAHVPDRPVPLPLRAGDRVWFRVEAAEPAWVYGIGVRRQARFERLWVSPPGQGAARLPWPAGRIVDAAFAGWDTVFVVASATELPWVEAAADCPAHAGKLPPAPPVTPCDHLYGLFWQVPPAPRGLVAPTVGEIATPGSRLPAIEKAQTRAGLAVVAFSFKARPADAPAAGTAGTLLRAGRSLDLATAPLSVRATRCRDVPPDTVQVWVEAAARTDPVLVVTVDAARMTPGLVVPIAAASPRGAAPAGVSAWLSSAGKAPTHRTPHTGWVRLERIARDGVVLQFEADFGALGKATGRLSVAAVETIVCKPPRPGGPRGR